VNALADWMAAYERAWSSNDPDEIGVLLSEDALYYTRDDDLPGPAACLQQPLGAPLRGRRQVSRVHRVVDDADRRIAVTLRRPSA
jgi:hypothetical protein